MRQRRRVLARRTRGISHLLGQRLGCDRHAAMVTESRPATNTSQALRADRIEVLFVQREVRVTMPASDGVVDSRRTARRTRYHRRIVAVRLAHLHRLPAMAVKVRADLVLGNRELAAARIAGDEQSHSGIATRIARALGWLEKFLAAARGDAVAIHAVRHPRERDAGDVDIALLELDIELLQRNCVRLRRLVELVGFGGEFGFQGS